MDLTFTFDNGDLICTFPPRMDSAVCKKLEPEILSRIENFDKSVVFDLKHVNYTSSAFLRICVAVGKKVGTDNFSCINVSPQVKKVFKIAGFDKIINIK